jgi:hypothetical protein
LRQERQKTPGGNLICAIVLIKAVIGGQKQRGLIPGAFFRAFTVGTPAIFFYLWSEGDKKALAYSVKTAIMTRALGV